METFPNLEWTHVLHVVPRLRQYAVALMPIRRVLRACAGRSFISSLLASFQPTI